jgi:hypothetical protein
MAEPYQRRGLTLRQTVDGDRAQASISFEACAAHPGEAAEAPRSGRLRHGGPAEQPDRFNVNPEARRRANRGLRFRDTPLHDAPTRPLHSTGRPLPRQPVATTHRADSPPRDTNTPSGTSQPSYHIGVLIRECHCIPALRDWKCTERRGDIETRGEVSDAQTEAAGDSARAAAGASTLIRGRQRAPNGSIAPCREA